jgi:hypothetical protein
MTQKLEVSWTTRHYSSLEAKPTEKLTDYSLVELPLAILQFFSLNHQTGSDKGFSWFFEAINLELLLSGFQQIFLTSF